MSAPVVALRVRTQRSVEPTATRAVVGDQPTPRIELPSALGVGASQTIDGAVCACAA